MKKSIVVLALLGLIFTQAQAGNLLDLIAKARGIGTINRPQNWGSRFSIPLETDPYWSSQTIGYSLWGCVLADINGDGYPEVIVVSEQDFCYLFANNNGNVSTTPTWQSNLWEYYIWPSLADYDHDGDLDMATACYSFPGGRARLFQNDNGNLTNDPVWSAQVGGGTICDWGDVDNDGDLDLAIADIFDYPAVFYNNNDTLEQIPSWRGTDYNIDFGVAWIDVDNDGDLDLAVGAFNYAMPTLRIYYNNNGTLETVASWKSATMGDPYGGFCLSPWDFDKDGWLDVAVSTGFSEAQNNVIFKNINGTLEDNPSWVSNDADASGGNRFGDLNGDGYLDWAVNNGGSGIVYENENGSINPTLAWQSTSSGGLGVDLGDVDRQGIVYKEDTIIADGTKKLFYLSIIPIQKIEQITINSNPVQLSDYCCNLWRGWVSFKNSIPSGAKVIFKFYYSVDMEFLLSDYTNNQVHLFQNNYIGVSEGTGQGIRTGLEIYPNPVVAGNPLKVSYALQNSSPVDAALYDCTGKKVATLFKKTAMSGLHTEQVFTHVPSGVYFLRLNMSNQKTVKKVVVMR